MQAQQQRNIYIVGMADLQEVIDNTSYFSRFLTTSPDEMQINVLKRIHYAQVTQ
jgi:hypothetical protein